MRFLAMGDAQLDERKRRIFAALRLGEQEMEVLRSLADYIWWESPKTALQRPDMLIAQVMQLGTFEDSMRFWRLWERFACAGALSTPRQGNSLQDPGTTGTIW